MLTYLFISLGINFLLFIPAFLYKTDKLTDLSYSLSFILVTSAALHFSLHTIILSLMIYLWALRLGAFLFIRIQKKRDKRFDGIRESFFKFLKFWMLQGLAVWIILLPSLYFIQGGIKFLWIGALIWLVGFIIETIADFQKSTFKKNTFIQSGLWKYSRHPNYFGEILCWTGIYIFVLPSLTPIQKLLGLISPLFIATLLIFFTGIPPLEKYAQEKWGEPYKKYRKRTSMLIPLPRK